MKLYSGFWHLLRLLPRFHGFRMCVLGLLSNFRSEFVALKKPKFHANFCSNLHGNWLCRNSARLVIFGGVVIFLAGNCVPTEVFILDAGNPVQLEVLMERGKLSRSFLDVGGKDSGEWICERCRGFCGLGALVFAPIPLTKLL